MKVSRENVMKNVMRNAIQKALIPSLDVEKKNDYDDV